MERKTFICSCNSLEHQFTLIYFNDYKEIYLTPHLITHKNFFKRIWYSVKYIFGYKSRYGAFDEIILSEKDQEELYNTLGNILKK